MRRASFHHFTRLSHPIIWNGESAAGKRTKSALNGGCRPLQRMRIDAAGLKASGGYFTRSASRVWVLGSSSASGSITRCIRERTKSDAHRRARASTCRSERL